MVFSSVAAYIRTENNFFREIASFNRQPLNTCSNSWIPLTWKKNPGNRTCYFLSHYSIIVQYLQCWFSVWFFSNDFVDNESFRWYFKRDHKVRHNLTSILLENSKLIYFMVYFFGMYFQHCDGFGFRLVCRICNHTISSMFRFVCLFHVEIVDIFIFKALDQKNSLMTKNK